MTMAYEGRAGRPEAKPDWFLADWMECRSMSQAELCRSTGLSKATVSQVVNGIQDYNPKLVRLAANALEIEIFELFMSPVLARAYREMRTAAIALACTEGSA
jgi:transcriptional regulator with XRE-family HTH domain